MGEVLISSPCLFAGYHLMPDESAQAMRAQWLRTGDFGYLADGQLYICGRKKDLLIIGGRNIPPDSIEQIAQSVLGKECRYAVAFGVLNRHLGTEIPIVVCEMRQQPDDTTSARLQQEIRSQVRSALQIFLADVYLVDKGWIIKTTSGKLKRPANRDKYLAEKKQGEPMVAPASSAHDRRRGCP